MTLWDENMQKLTILDGYKGEFVRRTAKFNLGQNVFVVDWCHKKPILMSAYILAIGIDAPTQVDNFIYMLNRGMHLEEQKKYYEDEIYESKYIAARELAKQMRKHLLNLKEMMKHPYYKHGITG